MAELRVCLDPGHGKLKNPGYARGFYEGTNNYYMALVMKEELEKYEDIKVFMTRDKLDDGTLDGPSLPERGQFAIDNKCDVVFSIHSNSYSSTAACGVSCFYSVLRPESKELLTKMAQAVVDIMRPTTGVTYLRGVCIRRLDEDNPKSKYYNQDWYGILRNSVKPDGSSCVKYAYIMEHGFHSNPKECSFLTDENNYRKMIAAEVKVFAEYFGKKLKPSPVPPTPTKPFKKGDLVEIIGTTWYSGKTIPKWVLEENWYVYSAPAGSDRIVINENESHTNEIMSPIHAKDLELVGKPEAPFKIGDKVKFKETATLWAGGQVIPSWVKSMPLYIRSEYRHDGEWIVVSTQKTGAVTGTALVKDLKHV